MHGYSLNILCRNVFDICRINRMVTSLMLVGYVNNYDKNRYLEKNPKAAVYYLAQIVKQIVLCF